MIKLSNELCAVELKAIKKLARSAIKIDEGLPEIYYELLKNKRRKNSNALYYERSTLIGVASLFFFHPAQAEITLLVSPNKRRQGIGLALMQAIWPTLIENHIKRISFSSALDPEGSGSNWLIEKGFRYNKSELQMAMTPKHRIHLPIKSAYTIRAASMKDLDTLISLDQLCFQKSHQNSLREHVTSQLNDPNYFIVVGEYQKKIMAKGQIQWEKDTAIISDIAVNPPHQKQGYGKILLVHLLNMIHEKKTRATLNVDTNNAHAIRLYRNQGFHLKKTFHYWSISMETFKMNFKLS